jgi:hypothetical protein
MQELWDHGGFYPEFKGKSVRPANIWYGWSSWGMVHETVTVKPKLQWRPKEGCQEYGSSAKESHSQWAQPIQERWHVAAARKTIGAKLPKPFVADIMSPCAPGAKHRATGFNVCHTRVWSCLGLIPHWYFSVPLFWNGNVWPVPPLCAGSLQFSLWFCKGSHLEFVLSLRGELGLGLLRVWGLLEWTKLILHYEVDISPWGAGGRMLWLGYEVSPCAKNINGLKT